MKSKVMNQTMTISISRWMVRTFPLLALAAMGLFASCRNEATTEPTPSKIAQDPTASYYEGEIEFPLEANFNVTFSEETESTLRGISATVSPTLNAKGRHGITLPDELPVLCIIRSSGNDEPTYYEAKAVKKANVYHISKERIRLRAGSTLAPGKKWYIMIAMGGTYDKNAGRMKFGSSGQESVSGATAAGRVMDIPAFSHWVEMPTHSNGQPKWPKDWSQAEKQRKLEIFPQGVLCRATLRLDDAYKQRLGSEQVTFKVNKLRVVSTSLSFEGYFSLAKGDLPAINFKDQSESVRGGANNGNLMKWVPTQAAAAKKEFTALNASTPEYEKVFTGDVFSLQGGSNAKIFSDTSVGADVQRNVAAGIPTFLFWAVPTTTADAEHRSTTLIAETGTSSNARILAPQHTYILGKKHNHHQVLSGKSVYFDAVYYHPYTPLDYMAEYNNQWPPRVDTERIDAGFSENHGVTSFSGVPLWRADELKLQAGGRNYKVPTVAQWESVIPFQGDAAIDLRGGRAVNEAPVEVEVGSLSGTTKFSSRRVGNVVYAIALVDLGGVQKYRVAYRYERVNNPDVVPQENLNRWLFTYFYDRHRYGPKRLKFRPGQEATNLGMAQFPGVAFQIDAVHIGSHFLGGVDDISNEVFWSISTLRKERRIIPPLYIPYGTEIEGKTLSLKVNDSQASRYLTLDKSKAPVCRAAYGWASESVNYQGDPDFYRFSCRLFTTEERP